MAYTPPRHSFRTFLIVWSAQSLSVIGSGMTGFALNVYLAQVLYPAPEKAELALAFTVNLGFTIPFVFGDPLAGAWADRHDRKQIMIVTNTANGLITLPTFSLMLSGSLQIWMLVGIGVLVAAAGAFHYAAFDESYAMLVTDRELPRANGMMLTTWSLSGIISPALAAFIIGLPVLLPRDVGALAPIVEMGNGTPLVIARVHHRYRAPSFWQVTTATHRLRSLLSHDLAATVQPRLQQGRLAPAPATDQGPFLAVRISCV
jgi:MFS transporter, DHA3 family, macrolide efflux protein